MTLLQVVNRVKQFSHRGDQAVTTDQDTQNIIDCVNECFWELALQIPKQAFRADGVVIPTVIGTEIYSLAGNTYPVQELIAVHYPFQNQSYNLKKVESEREFWGSIFILSQGHTRPYVYCPWGFDANSPPVKQIRIFPIPDAVYTLNYSYYVDPSIITFTVADLPNQIPFFPSYLMRPLWKGALYYFLKGFDDQTMMGIAKADYDEARLKQNIAEDADLDSDLQFRFDTGQTRFVDPATGIRLTSY